MKKLRIIDSTTISLFSNVIFKGLGRHPKIDRHKHVLGLSITKQFKFGGAFYNLFDYRPANHYNTPDYSYKYNPATNNINVQIKYTQTLGHNKVRGARDRSSTKHLERFKK